MGGRFSPYSSMCRKTDPLLPRAQSASLPYVRLIDVWLSDCIEIHILSTGAFRYGSTLAFTPAPSITHLMDVLVWISDWTQIIFTELLSYRTDFCLFDITGRNLKVNHRLTYVKYFCQTGYHCLTPISTKRIYSWMLYTFPTHYKKVTRIGPYPPFHHLNSKET